MNTKVISSILDVNSDWLQSVIDINYPQNKTKVFNFQITENKSLNGYTAIINLLYADASDILPKSLFLKYCKQDSRFITDSEYFYYKRDYAGLKDAPLPKCYDASFSETDSSYHVLLEDLSKTHYSNKDIRPTLQHATDVAEELARLHAYRWGNKVSELNTDTNAVKQIDSFITYTSKGLSPILAAVQSELPQEWLKTIEKIFDAHPQLMKKRTESLIGMTLIHGDSNPSNILSPNVPSGKTYIIDRQPFKWSITYWLGVLDLAHMIVPYWAAEDRRKLEEKMLKHYHQSLLKFGVGDYSWEQCLADYKLCIAYGVYTAIGWGTDEKDIIDMRWLWQEELKRSMEAFTDWRCIELLK